MSDETTTQPSPELQQIKTAMRATWMAGDFGVIAKTIEGAAGEFAARLGLAPGMHVLDVATGTGNVALPLARAGCLVTGVDIAPNLLEQARRRASAEGLQVAFAEGDAEQLPYAGASFDAVVTMFGAMFAPRPELVAAELARVVKPGGLVAMANWNPEGFTGKMFRVGAVHAPPPQGIEPPVRWGVPEVARQRLAMLTDIETELIAIDFDMPMSPAGAVDLFRTYFGPTKMAFGRLDAAGQAALETDLVSLWSSENIASEPEHHTLVRNTYLQVTGRRR